jgi:FlaA1/EpsC-like NDP-sugar epimerase
LAAAAATAASIVYLMFTQQMFPRSIYIYSCILDLVLIGGVRFGYRIIRDLRRPGAFMSLINTLRNSQGAEISRVMVVGAGDAGAASLKISNSIPISERKWSSSSTTIRTNRIGASWE